MSLKSIEAKNLHFVREKSETWQTECGHIDLSDSKTGICLSYEVERLNCNSGEVFTEYGCNMEVIC